MTPFRLLNRLFAAGFLAIVGLFVVCAFALIAFAGVELWHAVNPLSGQELADRFDGVLACVAMLTIAMVSLELADTVIEDEFRENPRVGTRERIRRVLSRFLVVVIVALAIESLVAVFKFVHKEPGHIVQAAWIAAAAAALLAAWGLFNRLDRSSSS